MGFAIRRLEVGSGRCSLAVRAAMVWAGVGLIGGGHSEESKPVALFPESGDRGRFERGLAESGRWRAELLGAPLEPYELAIARFLDQCGPELAKRKLPVPGERFRLVDGALRRALEGGGGELSAAIARKAFEAFKGRWWGMWDGMKVDQRWGPVVDVPGGSGAGSGGHLLRVRAAQYAWIGDGFGWNVICTVRPATEKSGRVASLDNGGGTVILGTVYHVSKGTRRDVVRHRAHVGIAIDAKSLIWITPGEVFLEERRMFQGRECYAISGFSYRRETEARAVSAVESFQAIYTRDSENRPPWIRLQRIVSPVAADPSN